MNPPFQDRLVQLSDGRPGLRSTLHCDVRPPAAPPAERQSEAGTAVLDFIASDATLDRYGEIISPDGWDLSTYQRNPVFQNAHQYGDILHTLGRALTTEVRTISGRQALFQRIQFAVEANPIAKIAHTLYAHGYLRAVSAGFIPIEWEDGTVAQASTSASDAGVPPACRRRYLHQELVEVSAVAIPANPNALALALKSGAIAKSDLQDTADLLRQLCPPTPEHPLLALTRQVRDTMKHA